MVLLIFVSALFIRLALSPYGNHPIDINDWIGWSNRLVEVPFNKFYDAWSDYLPGYLYVLWFLGHLKNFLYSSDLSIPLEAIYKFPAIIADVVLVLVSYKLSRPERSRYSPSSLHERADTPALESMYSPSHIHPRTENPWRSASEYKISKKFFDQTKALLVAAIFAFNPAIFINSALWGQVDVVNTLFYILTFIVFLQKRIFLAGIFLAISLLIKPQGVVLLPLIFLLAIKEKWRLTEFFEGITVFLLIYLGGFVPFSNKLNIFQFIFERYSVSLNQYQYTSLNAFNFWALGQRWWIPDSQIWFGLSLHFWGIIMFALVSVLVLWKFWQNYGGEEKDKLFLVNFSIALMFLDSFIFLTRVHERLLLTPLVFLMLAAIFRKELWFFVLILSVTYVLGLYFSFVWVTQNFRHIFSANTINIISALNVFVFVILLIILLKERTSDKSKTT